MSSLLERVFALLTSEAGSLTYHLILAFSIIGGLQLSVGNYQRSKSPRFWRTFGGLCTLLILQLILFISSGFSWQGIIEGNLWLPILDRAATLLSLIIIIWLWAFPDPSSFADLGTLLLSMFSLVAIIFGIFWWSNQGAGVGFNGSKLDVANQTFCLCLAILGMFFLLVRRPDRWGFGMGMLLLIMLGHVFQLFFYQRGEDFPGALRLGLMAAYPFLLFLPQHLQFSGFDKTRMTVENAADGAWSKDQYQTGHSLQQDPQIWKSLHTLATEDQPETLCKAIVVMLARTMQADLCFLLLPPDDSDRITIQCGYDLKNDRYLDKVTLYRKSLPALASSMRMGRIRQMASGSASPDMVNLAHAFELEQTGNLLSIPMLSSNGEAISSVVLLSPYSNRTWTPEDRSTLADLARLMVHFLQHNHEVVDLKDELEQVRQMTHTTQDQLQQVLEERQKLRHQFAVMQENSRRDQAQLAKLGIALSAHEEARKTIEQLEVEDHELKGATQLAVENLDLQEGISSGELRMALEEISFLSSALLDADRKIQTLSTQSLDGAPSDDQLGTLRMISQDLRKPLSSIAGYTDLLLGGSIGILAEVQRKYIERIKGSTERIGRLIDDLIQIASFKGRSKTSEQEKIDVCAVISQAALDIDRDIREKNISLELQLPDHSLQIMSDQNTLERIVGILLQNAATATPEGGKISIGVNLERTEGKQDYVLIQVSDTGGGIALQDLSRVFSPRTPATQIPGLGDSELDLPSVKVLVEMLGGRAWVDSEPEHGSVFSVLIPTISSIAVDRDGSGEE